MSLNYFVCGAAIVTGNAESEHQAAHQAKEFLISRVLQEAAVESISISEIERKMLYFSEQQQEPDDLFEVNAQFDEQYNAQEYEAKIAGLIKRAYERDKGSSDQLAQQWLDQIRALQREDHYILVMVSQAKIRLPGDGARLVASTAALAAILGAAIFISLKFDLSTSEARTLLWTTIFAMVAVWIVIAPERRSAVRQITLALVRGILPGSSRKNKH
ncbi:MAG: hypothetical protein ACREDR_38090 [Blastocatellia bacterium]